MTRTDEELVARATAGDVGQLQPAGGALGEAIYALAYRTLGREEDARDVVQEAFLRAYRGLRGFKGEAKFSSWLYRITLNLCRDWIRRERRAPIVQVPEGSDPVDLADERVAPHRVGGRPGRAAGDVAGGGQGDGRAARRAAHGDSVEGVSRPDVSGDCGPARLSAEYGKNTALSGSFGPPPASGAAAGGGSEPRRATWESS